jgi:fructose-1,6-bisphosphatase I
MEASVDYSVLEPGQQLYAEYLGEYYPARVVKVSKNKKWAATPVLVKFDNQPSESDEWMGADRLRSKLLKAKAQPKASSKKKAKPDEKKKEKEVPKKDEAVPVKTEKGSAPSEFDPYMNPDLYQRVSRKTMTQYILESTKGDQELTMLLNAIPHACKVVSNSIEKAGPAGLYGLAGTENSTGDDVKKLDLIADEIWIECLTRSGVCALLVSEEQEKPVDIPEANRHGPFCVAFDPLDGSSNIDCNVSVGSIFSVYRRVSESGPATEADILRPGTDMVVAGYCMYGAATELVITYGEGVQRFALDPSLLEFLYVSDMVMDPKGGKKIFSCNEGNSLQWDPPILDFVENCKETGYAARYVGSMVSDVHRTLLYGGIFLYPADKKSKKGKLRVLYEGFPMAMITEQAGGIASTGMFNGSIGRIMDVKPGDIHDRCPIVMGASRDVDALLKLYEKQ